jgi:hypothetical protein
MTTARNRVLRKVRSLLAKTLATGCTEEEMLSALAKARAMIDAYEITDEELKLTQEEKAIICPTGELRDKYDIKWQFISDVAEFCDCQAWHRAKEGEGFTFAGQAADIAWARHLTDRLAEFVQRELTDYLGKTVIPPYGRRRVINGFVQGIGWRISKKLRAEVKKSREQQQQAPVSSNASRALTLVRVKEKLIDDVMKAAKIKPRPVSSRRAIDNSSWSAGYAAGERASFNRPIGHTPRRQLTN